MCFHTKITKEEKKLEERFKVAFEDLNVYQKQYHNNGFNYGIQYIITQSNPHIIEPATWGLLPEYESKTETFRRSYNTLNAKSENAFNSDLFKEPIQKRRCLIVSDGFYESKHFNKKTYPHLIQYKSKEPFVFAGVYNYHNQYVLTCSILTMAANLFMSEIHNTKKRMPLILDPMFEKSWLDSTLEEKDIKEIFKIGFTKSALEAYTVSKAVTNSKIQSNFKEITNKVVYPELNTLF